jgi:hypothetical protein
MSNTFNIDTFNALVSQAKDTLICNTDCQNQKQAETLKQTYENSKANLASAPAQVQTAEKNYVLFTEGETAYNTLETDQLQKKAQEISNMFTQNFNNEVTKINSLIETYSGLLINFRNIVDLYIQYKTENIELAKQLKYETNDVLTNERKTFYEDQNIDSLKYYYYYFLFVIYVIFVLCFVAFSFFYPSQSSWVMKIFLFICFIILPFVSSWILATIIYLLYRLYNLLPKNVYNQSNY